MTMQKGEPYIKLFNTLLGVRVVSWILSQSNILCTSVVTYYTKNNDWPIIHCSHVMAILVTCSLTCSLPQLDILCTSAVKLYCAENDNSPFTCHLFSRTSEFMEAKKTCHWVVQTSICSISYFILHPVTLLGLIKFNVMLTIIGIFDVV